MGGGPCGGKLAEKKEDKLPDITMAAAYWGLQGERNNRIFRKLSTNS